MASRSKRVSLKGKGADIFFGDYAPSTETPETASEPLPVLPANQSAAESAAEQALPPDSTTASADTRKQASVQASKKVSTHASKRHSNLASKQASKQAERQQEDGRGWSSSGTRVDRGGDTPAVFEEITDEVWASVETPATITNSFRYTEAELEAVTDVLYEIGRNRGPRLTKQDVARLGLNVVLDDYRRRGPSSLLGQLAARRRPRHGG